MNAAAKSWERGGKGARPIAPSKQAVPNHARQMRMIAGIFLWQSILPNILAAS